MLQFPLSSLISQGLHEKLRVEEKVIDDCFLLAYPYENKAYFIVILFLFYMLFYSYHFCIFSLFSLTILKQFFTYFKPIILKQKIGKK